MKDTGWPWPSIPSWPNLPFKAIVLRIKQRRQKHCMPLWALQKQARMKTRHRELRIPCFLRGGLCFKFLEDASSGMAIFCEAGDGVYPFPADLIPGVVSWEAEPFKDLPVNSAVTYLLLLPRAKLSTHLKSVTQENYTVHFLSTYNIVVLQGWRMEAGRNGHKILGGKASWQCDRFTELCKRCCWSSKLFRLHSEFLSFLFFFLSRTLYFLFH